MRRKRPQPLALKSAADEKPRSFKFTDAGAIFTPASGSFKVRIDNDGGFASPLAKKEFQKMTLEDIEALEELGQGTSGVVRLARHKKTGKHLALKLIHLGEREKRHMLVNELKVLRRVEHAHLVNLYDCFYLDGYAYLALKFMNGGSVEQVLESFKSTNSGSSSGMIGEGGSSSSTHAQPQQASLGLPEDALADIVLQALCGLDHLHRVCHLIHRDLKPANVLIDSASGLCALSDFGIAKMVEESKVRIRPHMDCSSAQLAAAAIKT